MKKIKFKRKYYCFCGTHNLSKEDVKLFYIFIKVSVIFLIVLLTQILIWGSNSIQNKILVLLGMLILPYFWINAAKPLKYYPCYKQYRECLTLTWINIFTFPIISAIAFVRFITKSFIYNNSSNTFDIAALLLLILELYCILGLIIFIYLLIKLRKKVKQMGMSPKLVEK